MGTVGNRTCRSAQCPYTHTHNQNYQRKPGLFTSQMPEKCIRDNVHKNVKVPFLCLKIMDTTIFKRLKTLKQLGVAHHVYPGANTSRFEHCIGVMHLGGEYCSILQKSYAELITPTDILCVQIAGLCHDLGHGPFSHLWEDMVNKTREEGQPKFFHEKASLDLFDKIADRIRAYLVKELDETDLTFIKEMIIGKPLEGSSELKGRPNEKYFLYEIISNNETGVDVDKWDYLCRDKKSTGVENGFDYKRLMDNTKIVKVGDKNHLCYNEKTIDIVMDMWNVRTANHNSVYQHRTTKKLERMLLDALRSCDGIVKVNANGSCYNMSKAHLDYDAYVKMTDDWILGQIRNQEDAGLEKAKELLLRIDERKLYRTVGEAYSDLYPDQEYWEAELKKICDSLFANPPDLCISVKDVKMKDGKENPVTKCNFFKRRVGQNGVTADMLLDKSTIEQRLTNPPKNLFKYSFYIFCRNGILEDAIKCAEQFQQKFPQFNYNYDFCADEEEEE